MNSHKYQQEIKAESEILTFGKYKYKTIQHVLRVEPSYVLWLDEKEIVKFPVKIVNKACDLRDNQSHPYDDYENVSGDYDHNYYSNYYDE